MDEVPLQQVHPGHLHSNSTSHPWAFSAIAELIDNAQDPDVGASELWIDKEEISKKICLTFVDNGRGMDLDNLTKMLSFGYCDKKSLEDKLLPTDKPIGQYGNGFKSGSMRLANDAVVLTVCQERKAACVGLLSQTMCSERGLDRVVIPMIKYTLPDLQPCKGQSTGAFEQSLNAILEFSPYHKEEDLKEEFERITRQKIPRHLKTQKGQRGSGTKIVLYKLKMHKGLLELDFESDDKDIRNPETMEESEARLTEKTKPLEYKRSLRTYCKILYQKPKMKIYIRKEQVQTCFLRSTLLRPRTYTYRPKGKPDCEITFGIPDKTSTLEDYGVMFYHRNRLIVPYKKLGCQLKMDGKGVKVVGVVDVSDILTATHIKQEFVDDTAKRTAMLVFARKLDDYCGIAEQLDPSKGEEDNPWTWVQCNNCLKWRRLPEFAEKKTRGEWFCKNNPDPSKNRCDVQEEVLDEEEFDIIPGNAGETAGDNMAASPSTSSQAGDNTPRRSSKTAHRKRSMFTPAMDNAMLKQVLECKENPFKDNSAWKSVTANLMKADSQFKNKEINHVSKRFNTLRQNWSNGKRKGTPEEIAETEILMEKLDKLQEEADNSQRPKKSLTRAPPRDSVPVVSSSNPDTSTQPEGPQSGLKRKLSQPETVADDERSQSGLQRKLSQPEAVADDAGPPEDTATSQEPITLPATPPVAPAQELRERQITVAPDSQTGFIQTVVRLASPFLSKSRAEPVTSTVATQTIGPSDQSIPPKKSRISRPVRNKSNPVFSPWWQFRENVTSEGSEVYGSSSDVQLSVPEDAVPDSAIQIRGAVSTDLDKAYKRFITPDQREVLVSPIAEYAVYGQENFTFQEPVTISLPHFLPPDFDRSKVKVYRFYRDLQSRVRCHQLFPTSPDGNENPVTVATDRVKTEVGLQTEEREHGWRRSGAIKAEAASADEEDEEAEDVEMSSGRRKKPRAGFYFEDGTADKEVQILTYRFSGYFCTYEAQLAEPSHIALRLYARHVQRDTPCVDVMLLIWDLRLNIKDFREGSLPGGGFVYQHTATLPPLQGVDVRQVELGLTMEPESWAWTHRLDGSRQPLYPNRRRFPLQMFCRCVCGREPVRVHWSLGSARMTAPFEGHAMAGYVMRNDVNFRFLANRGEERMPVWVNVTGPGGAITDLPRADRRELPIKDCVYHRDG